MQLLFDARNIEAGLVSCKLIIFYVVCISALPLIHSSFVSENKFRREMSPELEKGWSRFWHRLRILVKNNNKKLQLKTYKVNREHLQGQICYLQFLAVEK